MSSYFRFLLIAAICLSSTMITFAQSSEETPETIVQKYWDALKAKDWEKCASLVHPQSLKAIRETTNEFVKAMLVIDQFGGNLRSYFGVSTKEEYDKLSDGVVFQQVLQRTQFLPILDATKYKLLGSIREADNLVHVVYRRDVELLDSQGNRLQSKKFEDSNGYIGFRIEVKLSELNKDRAEIMSVKKDGDAWRLLLNDDINQTINEWIKSIREFQGVLERFAKGVSDQNKSLPRKTGSKRQLRKH